LADQLQKDQYLKVVCVPKETVADAVQRLDGDPLPFVHTPHVLDPPVAPSP